MSVSFEVLLTVLGATVTVIGVVFGFGYKLSKYDSQIKKNSNDIDKLGSVTREEKRKVEGLQRDVMQLSTDMLQKFGEEMKPIRESIQLLTERSIQSHVDVKHFKEDISDVKQMMHDIKNEIVTRPCANHIKGELERLSREKAV